VDIDECLILWPILSKCYLTIRLGSHPWNYLVGEWNCSSSYIFVTISLWLFNSYNLILNRKMSQGDFFLLWRIPSIPLFDWFATSCMNTLLVTYRSIRWWDIWHSKHVMYVPSRVVNHSVISWSDSFAWSVMKGGLVSNTIWKIIVNKCSSNFSYVPLKLNYDKTL